MAATRKRKHAAEDDSQLLRQQGIAKFGQVSKSHSDLLDAKKRKTKHQVAATVLAPIENPSQHPKVDNKRKRLRAITPEHEEDSHEHGQDLKSSSKRAIKAPAVSTPPSKRVKDVHPSSPISTPSKGAAALFDRLKLSSAPTKTLRLNSSTHQETAYDTPPKTPEVNNACGADGTWTEEMDELCQLHAAFLSALSMYFAHNGASSPVDVRGLLSMVTGKWKRRNVALVDLRRLLGVEGQNSMFALQDSGRAGVFLTRTSPQNRMSMPAVSGFVDEPELSASFEQALQERWTIWKADPTHDSRNAAAFIASLPLCSIETDASVAKAAPLFARGQQRLADLRSSAAAAHAPHTSTSALPSQPLPPTSKAEASTRQSALLDRILNKSLLLSSLPSGPTKLQLERTAALQRLDDVSRVLTLASSSSSQGRCTMTLQATVQLLRQSLRNPMPAEQVERCLRLLEQEVAPGFVRVVERSGMVAVVIARASAVEGLVLKRRVEALLV